MEGFHTKAEAGRTLGVSVRTIDTYIASGKLRKMTFEGRTFIPSEDVEAYYDELVEGTPPGREEFNELRLEVLALREEVNVLKGGLALGRKREPRTPGELLLLRESLLNDLKRPGWTTRRMAQIVDEMMSLTEEDMICLVKLKGAAAWIPLFDLCQRMISWVEADENFPNRGLDVLHGRLLRAHDRLFGLVFASTRIKTALPKREARMIVRELDLEPGVVDQFITHFVLSAQK